MNSALLKRVHTASPEPPLNNSLFKASIIGATRAVAHHWNKTLSAGVVFKVGIPTSSIASHRVDAMLGLIVSMWDCRNEQYPYKLPVSLALYQNLALARGFELSAGGYIGLGILAVIHTSESWTENMLNSYHHGVLTSNASALVHWYSPSVIPLNKNTLVPSLHQVATSIVVSELIAIRRTANFPNSIHIPLITQIQEHTMSKTNRWGSGKEGRLRRRVVLAAEASDTNIYKQRQYLGASKDPALHSPPLTWHTVHKIKEAGRTEKPMGEGSGQWLV
ncbi:hypothetical protein DFP72DRAFT_1045030 [Ephemerocybe angulata]|uniref:Uncharacterized protein n=1 Tax=Ephemerocybe angulata TaxID=980116 RepID=A0A8H6M9G9_9AGAR|nr:hypothetical protein DFP72DRAFT_1045030 [Tulosesus angulatus]